MTEHTDLTDSVVPDSGVHREQSAAHWRFRQMVTVLYGNSYTALSGSVIGMGVTAFVLADVFPAWQLWIWFGVALLLSLARLLVYRRYTSNPEACSPQAWLGWHRGLTFVSGCLYGALGVLFFGDNPLYQAVVIFVICGMASGAVGTYAVDLLTYKLFLFPAVIPLMGRILQEGERPHLALGILIGVLTLVLMKAARQASRIMTDNIDLTFSLQYRATHDSLVGLLNREEFEHVFEDRTAGQHVTACLLFIDLDHFKAVNDTLGHQAGDKVLKSIGDIIRSSVRADDVAGRMGGDEFVILLCPANVAQAEIVAQHILDKITRYQAVLPEAHPRLGASIGIGYCVDEPVKYKSMMRAADMACYEIKRSGKGAFGHHRVTDV